MGLCGLGHLEKCQPMHFKDQTQLSASPMCLCGTFIFLPPFVPVNACTLSEMTDPQGPAGTCGRLTDINAFRPKKAL